MKSLIESDMKKILISASLFLLCSTSFCQKVVFDPVLCSGLFATHAEAMTEWNTINTEQKKIILSQTTTMGMLTQIKKTEKKIYDYLSKVNDVVKNVKDLAYAYEISVGIKKNMNKIISLTASDPELQIVSVKTESFLLKRSADLMLYIANMALKGGDQNLLDNKQRTDIIIHVIKELSIMRSLTFSIYNQMLVAKQDGIIKSLFPEEYQFATNTQADVDQILSSLHK